MTDDSFSLNLILLPARRQNVMYKDMLHITPHENACALVQERPFNLVLHPS